jgi:hypothetical protein
MKKIYILLAAAVFLAIQACNSDERLRLEELQGQMASIKEAGVASMPDAVSPSPDDPHEYAFTFDSSRYGVDAGKSVCVKYALPESSIVEVSVPEGWSATVNNAASEIVISAPDPASPVEIVATAVTSDGKKTAAIVPVMVRDPYSDATRPDFMAMGYYGFKPQWATPENFQKLADAGLKAITIETDTDDYMYQLDLAYQVGMKGVMVVWPYAERFALYGDTTLDDVINQLKVHPATMAYHIYDEPSTNLIPYLKLQKDRIESLDQEHPVYINLNPDGSAGALGVNYYHDYIEAFARDCQCKFISFDMYPMRPETDPDYHDGIVGYWYQCMEAVSSITKKYGIPFWAFAASCWIDNEKHLFAKPTVENLRMQVYTDLAYGAQVVEYFTIMQYGGTSYAPILLDGTWTEAYDTLKEVNLEMQKRGYIFNGCKMDRVRYTHLLPAFCMQLSPKDLPEQIASLSTAGNAIVSFIENKGNEYVVVCNRSFKDTNTLDLILNDMVYVIDREGAFIECPAGPASFAMEAGDMLVIKIK